MTGRPEKSQQRISKKLFGYMDPELIFGYVDSVATLMLLHSAHGGGASGRILILSLAVPCFIAAVHTLRIFWRNTDKLENVRMSDALSSCCEQKICGRGVACDHDIILGCISWWFGSIPNFEHHVRRGNALSSGAETGEPCLFVQALPAGVFSGLLALLG